MPATRPGAPGQSSTTSNAYFHDLSEASAANSEASESERDGSEVEGLFGMPEPTGELLGPIAVNDVDLMVIPAAAVDTTGMRLGWGRGYFDKTIGSMERCPPVYAVVFDDELVAEVPRDVHDQPVTGVVTPTRIVDLHPPHT